MVPRQRLVLGVFRHLLQSGINGGIHPGINITLKQQRLAASRAVAGNLFLGGGIHDPNVTLPGPGKPPTLHELVLAVEPLIVLEQIGVVGGGLGASQDAVGHRAQGRVEQNSEHTHSHYESAKAQIAAIDTNDVAIGQHHRHCLDRIAESRLVQPLSVGASAERASKCLNADDARRRRQHTLHGNQVGVNSIEWRARLIGHSIGGLIQLSAQVLQIHQQCLAPLGIDAVDRFKGEARTNEPQLAM